MQSAALIAGLVCLAGSTFTAAAQTTSRLPTPPLASGRSLDDPAGITAADVLARTSLLREHLELIRRFMGRPRAARPLVRAENATIDEAYFNAISIRYRSSQFAFELLRTELEWRPPPLPTRKVLPSDVFLLVDATLAVILRIRAKLGIEEVPTEKVLPESTTATDLFNALLETAGTVDGLLDMQAQATNGYIINTVLIHQAMQIHLAQTKKMMPEEPAFEPNRTPEDAFRQLMKCFTLIRRIADSMDLPVASLERDSTAGREATNNDVTDLGIIAIAELDRMIRALDMTREDPVSYAPDRKYPSHVLQRSHLLTRILQDIAEARGVDASP